MHKRDKKLYKYDKFEFLSKMMRCLLILLTVFMTPFVVQASYLPDPYYRVYQTQDGLSQASVYSITQDQQGYLWLATEDGLNRFDGQHFRVYRYDSQQTDSIASNNIMLVYTDPTGRLWVGTDNGLSLYDAQQDSFQHWQSAQGLQHETIYALALIDEELWIGTEQGLHILNMQTQQIRLVPVKQDGSGISHPWVSKIVATEDDIWIATFGGGLNRYERQSQRFHYYLSADEEPSSLSANQLLGLTVDQQGQIWTAGYQAALNVYQQACDCWQRVTVYPDYPFALINGFVPTENGLWMAGSNGLAYFDHVSQRWQRYALRDQQGEATIKRDIRSIYRSRDGSIWLGTHKNGLLHLAPSAFQFSRYTASGSQPLAEVDITALALDQQQRLLAASFKGLHRYTFNHDGALGPAEKVFSAMATEIKPQTDGSTWLATNKGVYHLDEQWQEIAYYGPELIPPALRADVRFSYAFTLSLGPDGAVYAGTWQGGLSIIKNGQIKHIYQGLPDLSVQTMQWQNNDTLWLGTGDGLVRFQPSTGTSEHHALRAQADQSPIVVNHLITFQAKLWAATSNGLYYLQDNRWQHQALAMTSPMIVGLQGQGEYLWLSTENGLYRYHLNTGQVTQFTEQDGLADNVYNLKSAVTHQGLMLYGGLNGITKVNVAQLPQVKAQVAWQASTVQTPRGIELYEASQAMVIPADLEQLTVRFFSDDFTRPEAQQYRYRLNQGTWLDNQQRRTIALTGLAPGDYQLQLGFRPHQGDWQQGPALNLAILAPWYASKPAYVAYLLLILLMATAIYKWRVKQLKQRQLVLENTVAERTAEVKALLTEKESLFANISHELRTPLTLINAPLAQLEQDKSLAQPQHKLVTVAQNNGRRLLHLVERVLALTGIEHRQKHIQEIVLPSLLTRYVIAFEPLFAERNIRFSTTFNAPVSTQADEDDFASVIENLLSNALKYTTVDGWVEMHTELNAEGLQLSVKNAHIGLSEAQISKVFNRFERLGQSEGVRGFGLGLAYVYELCQYYGWQIDCHSAPGYVAFNLQIPNVTPVTEQMANDAERQRYTLGLSLSPVHEGAERLQVLVVEDNHDLREFLVSILKADYQVLAAENGQQGVRLAKEQVPNIVITDLMMPEFDGYQLVEALAQDEVTSHIPSIILTARADEDSVIRGLETGSVDYITKPFDARQLLLKVQNTLARQQALIASRQAQQQAGGTQQFSSERDQQFFVRLQAAIEQGYAQADFATQQLAEALFMSERQLQRKIKALYDQTPAEYLRAYRIEVAKTLLLSGKSIGLAADLCGFNSASYFSRTFKQVVGVAPKVFVEQQ